jgi:hypothetical protein
MADRPFWTFDDGLLESGDYEWKFPFKARIDKFGEVEFDIAPLPETAQTFKIHTLWHEHRGTLHQFELAGTTTDGIQFQSKTVHFTSMSTSSGEVGSSMTLTARCNLGTFTETIQKATGKLAMLESYRGLECFGFVHGQCPLGEIALRGMSPLPDDGSVSGRLHLVCHEPPADVAQWQEQASRLFEHVRNVLSFAESRTIKAPLRQTWIGENYTAVCSAQTKVAGAEMQVFHHLNLQPIFDVAVSSFFNPPIPAKKLFFAIEWFAMRATYSETRLLNAMTALENLTNANLLDAEKQMLDEKRFDKIAKDMRKAFVPEGPEETAFRNSLAGKMLDLNRRPLKDKIEILAERWNVPLHDLPAGAVGAAVTARNAVVHRGHYYDDDEDAAEKQNLWGHILITREVVVRFILTALGYKGRYISFLGGAHHDVDFPPPPN